MVIRSDAIVAPWISATGKDDLAIEPTLSTYCECISCGLFFYSRRFSSTELQLMYSHYRDEKYLKNRQFWEPWYTKKLNDVNQFDDDVLRQRRTHLEDLLGKAIDREDISPPYSVVDWGGDRGQFIPRMSYLKEIYVYEVSDAITLPGCTKLMHPDEVFGVSPDLIMLCNVLEHDHDARNVVSSISANIKDGGLLYIEFPLDRPGVIPSKGLNRKILKVALRWRIIWIAIDFYSLLSTRILKKSLPFQIMKQSEHVNFFCKQSIFSVVCELGFDVVSESTYQWSMSRFLKANVFGALFIKKKQSSNLP